MHHPPHPSAPQPPPTVTSPPSTPSAANRSTSLSANAGAFVPAKKVSIKNASGQEVTLDTLKRAPPPPTIPPHPPSPASVKKDIKRQPIRIESQEQKEKRLAEERAKEGEGGDKSKSSDALVRANEAAARRELEEQERRKEQERKAKEEAERAEKERKEAEERAILEKERREAEERAAREEQERREAEERAAKEAREKEEQEKERVRLEEARVAEEKAEKERVERERLRKLQEEEEARAKEAERQRKEEEDKLKVVEASEIVHSLPDDAEESTSSLPEEGEVEDEASRPATTATKELASANKSAAAPQPPPSLQLAPHIPQELPVKSVEKEPLRIDTTLPQSPEHQRRRPGPLNLQTTINSTIAPPLPSALATARHIEDINRITYPQGIKSPKLELNVNTQKGKFRYDFEIIYHRAFVSLNMISSQL
jgi:translation initiation factor 4G